LEFVNAYLLELNSFQALIFPPKEILILIFGAIGFTTGTYAAILAIVQEFSN
jgi:uncharacterized membrane protein